MDIPCTISQSLDVLLSFSRNRYFLLVTDASLTQSVAAILLCLVFFTKNSIASSMLSCDKPISLHRAIRLSSVQLSVENSLSFSRPSFSFALAIIRSILSCEIYPTQQIRKQTGTVESNDTANGNTVMMPKNAIDNVVNKQTQIVPQWYCFSKFFLMIKCATQNIAACIGL